MGDWIKLHRLLLEWEWYTTPNMAHFFVYCLLKASHKKRQWMGIELSEGQFISGRKVMSLETGLTEQEVRTCLERLKSTSELTSKTTNKYSIFTINSWNKYQLDEPSNQQPNQQVTSKQPASNHRQEGKKERRKENTEVVIPERLKSISGFEVAWENWVAYIKSVNRKVSNHTLDLHLKKLESDSNPIGTINESIERSWKGLFPKQTAIVIAHQETKQTFKSDVDSFLKEMYD